MAGSNAHEIQFMRMALEEARKAFDRQEVPVGCVIVHNGEVIGAGSNRSNETRNATRHAELEAIDVVLEKLEKDGSSEEEASKKFQECELFVTCEPCIMCAGALAILGIGQVIFGCQNDRFGGCGSVLSLHTDGAKACGGPNPSAPQEDEKMKPFKCKGGVLADDAVALLRDFYERGNPNAPRPHRAVTAA
ncbi:hypothetical protein CBR_g19929 [Chara braunii]|uniref:CMP/dCMP-type deaminase domain-containing protein n=1 Tax=Chara braunii TaxID=69332 RepID=A0A388KZ09_CHABU|nr:hypothetical protein CBR_g19929 [Chara braunii]|eukprot:GBG75297.1 hypothetical protein CBR_g19929 [Chara braunii]